MVRETSRRLESPTKSQKPGAAVAFTPRNTLKTTKIVAHHESPISNPDERSDLGDSTGIFDDDSVAEFVAAPGLKSPLHKPTVRKMVREREGPSALRVQGQAGVGSDKVDNVVYPTLSMPEASSSRPEGVIEATPSSTSNTARGRVDNIQPQSRQPNVVNPTNAPSAPSQRSSTLPNTSKPLSDPNTRLSNGSRGGSIEFGQASPLRNPLGRNSGNSHVFNIPKAGKPRPEHHRPTSGSVQPNMYHTSSLHQQSGSSAGAQSRQTSGSYSSMGSRGERNIPIDLGTSLRSSPEVMEIPRPTNYHPRSTYAAPRPTFSTLPGPSSGFQPVSFNPYKKPVVDLTQQDEDEINPDEGLRAPTAFGAPDIYDYVEAGKAHESMKQLLEGAIGDEEAERPRLRKRKPKKTSAVEKEVKSLADRMKALDVKQEVKNEPEEEDDADDGTVEGLAVQLLPHQVEGVAWMVDKEVQFKRKTRGGILADDMGLGKTIQSVALMLQNPRPSVEEGEADKKNKIPASCSKATLVVAPLALIKQWEAEIKSKVTREHALRVLVHHGPSRTKRGDDLKKYDVVITTYQTLTAEHASTDDTIKTGCFGVPWYRIILDEAHSIKNRLAKSTKACYALRSHYRWCLTGTPMQNNLEELQSLIAFLRIKPYDELSHWKEQIAMPLKNGKGHLAIRRLQFFLRACMKRRTKDVLKKDGALHPGGKPKAGEESKGFTIVDRKVETVECDFSPEERRFYDRLQERAQSSLEVMMKGDRADYIGALVLLLRLRQACNHPELVGSNVKNDKDALPTRPGSNESIPMTPGKKSGGDDLDDLADLLGGMSVQTKKCDICGTRLTADNRGQASGHCADCDEDLQVQRGSSRKPKPQKKKEKHHRETAQQREQRRRLLRRIVDSDDESEAGGDWVAPKDQRQKVDLGVAGDTDDENADGAGEWLKSDDSETDSEAEVDRGSRLTRRARQSTATTSTDRTADSSNESEDDDGEANTSLISTKSVTYRGDRLSPSTKITHLLSILAKETPSHKIIVFSQFTTMLDMIEPFLHSRKLTFTRYDGSMRNDLREASLDRLRNDPRTRILLCSLKCGSLGLNLTAASRVVLMEPFWNPFVEDQAIDRVHRLNQTTAVHVYRLTVSSSVESRILDLQAAKRKLAAAALEGGAGSGKKAGMNISMADILKLFRPEAELDERWVGEVDGANRRGLLEGPEERGGASKAAREDRGPDVRSKGRVNKGRRVEDPVYGRR